MNLLLDTNHLNSFKSKSQRARVLTEHWMEQNMFCPICGQNLLTQFPANRPVADFYCEKCLAQYELKSKEKFSIATQNIIPDGCYETMIQRITSLNNPNLFVMTHFNSRVNNILFIPNFFFTPEIILKRPPLKETARRAGWVGCNINIGAIPNEAKIPIIKDGEITPLPKVIDHYNHLLSLKTEKLQSRGWLMDTMSCIEQIQTETFSLKDIYAFEQVLKSKHPDNNFIKDKLRQQLQILRDKGFIEFTSRGNYKKVIL